jgi:VIT1/CCC1 family predicted Fe2+/Mn2+ transporter
MAKERYEIKHHPEMEKKETIAILKSRGFSEKDAIILTETYMKNPSYWLSFMMNDELKLPNSLEEKPHYTSLATFLAFVLFGIIPLVPYILNPTPEAFTGSLAFSLIALIILGLIRFKVTGENIVRCVLEIFAVGSLAAAIAYFVGSLFTI